MYAGQQNYQDEGDANSDILVKVKNEMLAIAELSRSQVANCAFDVV